MSGPDKNNTHYSASDIQKYLKGEFSAREMHELEKAALEDPFLADALEGFEQQTAPVQPDLQQLQARLEARVTEEEKSPVILFREPWQKIAAAIILLLGLGMTAYYALQDSARQPENLAKAASKPTPPPMADTIQTAPPAQTPPPAQVQPPAQVPPPAMAKKTTPAPSRSETSLQMDTAAAPALTYLRRPTATLRAVTIEKDTSTYILDKETSPRRIEPLLLTGKVLDQNNNPLPGATLHLAGKENIGTVTDQQGYFSIKLKPQDSTHRLTVALVGYEQTSLALNSLNANAQRGNIIHLQPQQASLDEVVVVGYGSKRKETRAAAPSSSTDRIDSLWIRALPLIGRKAYLDYLLAGRKTIAVDSSIRGTVIISFEVDPQGLLSSFKVEQSLSPAHDAGVIRLVSEGPAWRLIKGRKVRASVQVAF